MKKNRWKKVSWIAAFLAGILWAYSFGVSAEDLTEEEWEILDEAEKETEILEIEDLYSTEESETENEVFLIETMQVEDPMLYEASPTASGTCGENVEWNFSNGTLTVKGTGNGVMEDYDYDSQTNTPPPPWQSLRGDIHVINISGVKYVGDYAFFNCSNLQEFNLGEGIQELGFMCFAFCDQISQIILPNSLKKIGSCAFESLSHNPLKIHIPENVSDIAYTAFYSRAIEEYTVDSENSHYYARDGVLFAKSSYDSLWAYPTLKTDSIYQVPNGVCGIEMCAFSGNVFLQEVTLTDSIVFIGMEAFSKCTKLQKIVFPKSVESVAWEAFQGCTSLQSVEFADTSTSKVTLSQSCFKGCTSLKQVKLSRDTATIGGESFKGCTSLREITIPASVTNIGGLNTEINAANVFEGCGNPFTIYYYAGSYAETYAKTYAEKYRFSAISHEHQFKTEIIEAATCFSEGKAVLECSCGTELGTEILPQLVHSYGEWEFHSINEEQQIMYEIRRCDLCGTGEVRDKEKVIRVEELQNMQFKVGDTVVVDTRVSARTVSLKSSDSKAVSLTTLKNSRYVLLKASKTSKKVTISYQKNSKTYKCDVSVEAPTTYIDITGKKSQLYIGEELYLLVSRNEDATDEFTCRVLDAAVVSASFDGTQVTVKALKKGKTTIQVSAGNVTKEYIITVEEKDTDYLSVNGNENIRIGDAIIWEIARNEEAQNRIEVSVENGALAEAELIGSHIRIQGKKPGTTVVVVKSGQKTVRKTIVVQKQQNRIITEAALTRKQPVKKFYLNVTQIGDGKITYTSNNKKVKVNKNGCVTVKKGFKGKAKITVSVSETVRYLGAKKVITLTVKKK